LPKDRTSFNLCAGALAYVAYNPAMKFRAYPAILTNAGGAAMFLVLALHRHGQLLKLPILYLMDGTAMFASLGMSNHSVV
jgi:hypothetical protein